MFILELALLQVDFNGSGALEFQEFLRLMPGTRLCLMPRIMIRPSFMGVFHERICLVGMSIPSKLKTSQCLISFICFMQPLRRIHREDEVNTRLSWQRGGSPAYSSFGDERL